MSIDLVRKLTIDTSFGVVDINGIYFDGTTHPCFGCPDLSWVYDGPATRGADRVLPGVVGVKPYPRRATVTKRNVPVMVIGAMSPSGTPYADYGVGVQQNWDYLKVHVITPPTLTYVATWHRPDGTTRTAQVVVEKATATLQPGAQMRGLLEISMPYGDFA